MSSCYRFGLRSNMRIHLGDRDPLLESEDYVSTVEMEQCDTIDKSNNKKLDVLYTDPKLKLKPVVQLNRINENSRSFQIKRTDFKDIDYTISNPKKSIRHSPRGLCSIKVQSTNQPTSLFEKGMMGRNFQGSVVKKRDPKLNKQPIVKLEKIIGDPKLSKWLRPVVSLQRIN